MHDTGAAAPAHVDRYHLPMAKRKKAAKKRKPAKKKAAAKKKKR